MKWRKLVFAQAAQLNENLSQLPVAPNAIVLHVRIPIETGKNIFHSSQGSSIDLYIGQMVSFPQLISGFLPRPNRLHSIKTLGSPPP